MKILLEYKNSKVKDCEFPLPAGNLGQMSLETLLCEI